MIAGPSDTTKMLGKMNSTRGKRSFTPVLAAPSSAACMRRERNVSSEDAERMSNGCAESLGLHKHGDKLADKLNIKALSHAAPRIQTRLSGALLTVDDLEFFRQTGRGDGHFLANAHHGLVDTESGFHANHQQIERIRQGNADIGLAASHQV